MNVPTELPDNCANARFFSASMLLERQPAAYFFGLFFL